MDCRPSRTRDPEEWIATCPIGSKAICEELRDLIFRWEPDLKESINSNMLCFSLRKRVCAVSGFVKNAQITFFRGRELPDPARLFNHGLENASIHSIDLTTLEGLNLRAFRALLHAAVLLDGEPSMPKPPSMPREEWPMPEILAAALKKNKAAAAFYDQLKPTYQREYKVWVSTAKQTETIARRLEETIRALAAGKKWAQRKEAC
ncbi:MAG: YdeI/OmpD-associated family protein [Prosthecobacter sp.]|nr:YdeI/OmpD-associated family protein [Prosthecobacter sp.]